ncbi:DUF3108 domain-containing protein [Geomonas subterranea]|uniref:DUF3108 domain-containing protein n=1 Tax=Geomonas subterranea TaxID=2847989 RepID=A0ABX8LMY9_9BACT|nr:MULTISPECIES: DUF3108 domain-containing protein [Geomonas]QXE90900.1 DUF3108 domain-containing protein [Geomonas subterranea]QXM11015.1 DUF3108 domain-containing protein [Geomonas subterranea]
MTKLAHRLLPAVFFFAFSAGANAYAAETLNYQLTWTGVKIGTSTLSTAATGSGVEITSKVRSAAWSAPFYKVDDLETSKLDREGKGFALHSYKMKLREGRNDWHRAASVNRKSKRFEFVNLKTFEKSSAKLVEPAWDPVSCLFHLRQLPLAVGREVEVNVLDKGKLNRIKVSVLRRETVQTPAGSFRTIVISPNMDIESEGLFYARGPLTIWLTDDAKKVPVMIEKRINDLFRDGVPAYLQQFTPASVKSNIPRMETIRAVLVGGSY